MQAKGVNPDAFKDWEITKKNQVIGNAKTGLTPETKKRMRESFALQCKGEVASVNGVDVVLEGENHDRLIFSVNATMTKDTSKGFVDSLQQLDPDFGNRLRFLNFSELVLAGTNYSKSFSQGDFGKWSQNYDSFVSNMISMFATTGNQSSFFSKKDEISPEMQKTMRGRLAAAFNGSFNAVYKSFVVKLMGTNDDVLVFSCMDLDGKGMSDILKTFKDNKDGNFFNGLTAMGFSEFDLEANNYRRAIPRSEFIQWCRNYDKYMAELQKVVSQMSDAMKHDNNSP